MIIQNQFPVLEIFASSPLPDYVSILLFLSLLDFCFLQLNTASLQQIIKFMRVKLTFGNSADTEQRGIYWKSDSIPFDPTFKKSMGRATSTIGGFNWMCYWIPRPLEFSWKRIWRTKWRRRDFGTSQRS